VAPKDLEKRRPSRSSSPGLSSAPHDPDAPESGAPFNPPPPPPPPKAGMGGKGAFEADRVSPDDFFKGSPSHKCDGGRDCDLRRRSDGPHRRSARADRQWHATRRRRPPPFSRTRPGISRRHGAAKGIVSTWSLRYPGAAGQWWEESRSCIDALFVVCRRPARPSS
jgi:hypothetical protein